MTDTTTVDHIIELKQKLLKDKAPQVFKRKFKYSYLEGIEMNTPFNSAYTESMSNRGNKLYSDESLTVSHLRSYPSKLQVQISEEEDKLIVDEEEVYEKAKRRKLNNKDESDDEEQDFDLENPLLSINLTEILLPIQHPSDIISRDSIKNVFNPEKKGNHLLKLAYDTLEMIESEQNNVIELTKLMNIFLGDEHHDLTPDNINLPDYDHKLSLKDLNLSIIDNPTELFKDDDNGDADSAAADDTKEEDESQHKIQTRSKDNLKITDPFFQLPNFKQNKSIETLDPLELEDLRLLTQITLQRNQEFIRCLAKIRNGCVRVDKFKQNIYKWAKEMHGDFSDDQELKMENGDNNSSKESSAS